MARRGRDDVPALRLVLAQGQVSTELAAKELGEFPKHCSEFPALLRGEVLLLVGDLIGVLSTMFGLRLVELLYPSGLSMSSWSSMMMLAFAGGLCSDKRGLSAEDGSSCGKSASPERLSRRVAWLEWTLHCARAIEWIAAAVARRLEAGGNHCRV